MPEIIAATQIDSSNAHLDPETNTYQFDDSAALKLVIDDAKNTDAWMNFAQWASRWQQADELLQSPQTSFDGLAGMTVPKFTLSNIVSAVVPKIMGGFFYDDPPFLLRPRPGSDPNVIRAKTALAAYQLDEMKFEEEIEAGVEQMALLGTAIWKWGWLRKKKKVKKYVRKENAVPVDTPFRIATVRTPSYSEFKPEIDEIDIERPWFKACDIRTVLVDMGTRRGDIRKAKAVTIREYPTWKELDDLRDVEGYDIPDDLENFFLDRKITPHPDNITMTMPESMRGFLQHAVPRNYPSSADPLQNGPELLERVDNDKVITVLRMDDNWVLIRNQPNEYGKINYYSANWRNIPDAFYGQGLGQLVGTEQMVEQGTTTLALAMLAYGLQPTGVRKTGFNAISQPNKWELGGIINVEDDVDKGFKFLEFPPVPPEAWAFIQQSKADSAETSGANQQTTMGAGAAGVKTTGMRSGTGAALVGQANASRLDGPTERIIRQVFVPWLYEMDELNNDKLPGDILDSVLGEELGHEFKVDHEKFRNAKMEYDVLAGAHLGAKKEMAQFLPFVEQILNNPSILELAAEQGYMPDFINWWNNFTDLAGFKWGQNFFVKMNPKQQKRRALNSPAGLAAIKGQTANQGQLQKFQQEQQLLDQEQIGKGANEAQRLILEHVLDAGDTGPEGTFGDVDEA